MSTTTHDLDEQRWEAVHDRAEISGRPFVYAVTTTGVYCVPTCAARRPRRENTRFFANATEAREAGFRACLRCRPDGDDPYLDVALRAIEAIETDTSPMLGVEELASRVGTSTSTLRRSFVHATGLTPRQYADNVRRRRLRARLREGASVAEAQYEAGYGSGSRLYEAASGILGTTPARYRDGAPGVAIGYATACGPLGPYLAAATEHGICHVALGPNQQAVVADLHEEFPQAVLRSNDALLHEALAAIGELLELRAPDVRLPIDVRATAFQRQVWEFLREIPLGDTRTYGEVAQAIGRPSATRAVARACGSNPLALLTPCHRVIAVDGKLSGYRWGVGVKGALLAREAAGNPDVSP